MSEPRPKLEDYQLDTLCLLVLDQGKLFPEIFHPQLAARLHELLPKRPKRRGRPPSRTRQAVMLVHDAMQAGDPNFSQALICSAVATSFGLQPRTVEREYQKLKQANQGAGKLI